MKSTFLEKNKKKSLLAALLLFLRERKVLVVLLLLVFIASTVFLSPSSWITGLPGGTRLAASVAWIAGKLGVDVSQWGLGGDKHSFSELTAAFASAKANQGKGAIGWGAFFGRSSGAGGDGQDSLGFVKGSKSDLGASVGSGKNGSGADGSGNGIAGAITPEDAKADQNANAVAINQNDVGGEREGWVKNAFAGGFVNGFMGTGAGADGAAQLSGGAFASKGFFTGKGGAASESNSVAQNGLNGAGSISVPKSKIQGAAKGQLSYKQATALDARSMKGAAAASTIGGNRAFTQLAEGRGRAALAVTPNCAPPGCPGEFATTNTGAIYDGNQVSGSNTDLITAPTVDGVQTPNIPDTSMAQGYEDQANQMDADAQKCQALDAQYGPQETALNQQMMDISGQFKSAGCGSGGCSQSKANYCKGLGNQLKSTCNQYMSVRCAHTHACPLTASQNCSNECQEGGNGGTGNATSVHVNSDAGSGNSDGSGMTTVPQ
jgi:hypothetical protein